MKNQQTKYKIKNSGKDYKRDNPLIICEKVNQPKYKKQK